MYHYKTRMSNNISFRPSQNWPRGGVLRCSDWFTPLIALGSIVPLIGENVRPRPLLVAPSLPSRSGAVFSTLGCEKWGFWSALLRVTLVQRKEIFTPDDWALNTTHVKRATWHDKVQTCLAVSGSRTHLFNITKNFSLIFRPLQIPYHSFLYSPPTWLLTWSDEALANVPSLPNDLLAFPTVPFRSIALAFIYFRSLSWYPQLSATAPLMSGKAWERERGGI